MPVFRWYGESIGKIERCKRLIFEQAANRVYGAAFSGNNQAVALSGFRDRRGS